MRILITGANGQVGCELLRALAGRRMAKSTSPSVPLPVEGGRSVTPFETKGEENHPLRNEGGRRVAAGGWTRREIIPATRDGTLEDGTPCERIDLADGDDLRNALDRIHPDLIVNAAAYTAVDRAEDEEALAMRINGEAVGMLGNWAAQRDARVVHYSTDYVFDGEATRAYRENDATRPASAYGRSKLVGEIALRDSRARHLMLRPAWVYGARGHNFLRTMLRLGAERDELRVVDDQIGAPTSARLIADVTAQAVARWFGSSETEGGSTPPDGTYHLVASGSTSWCGFACAIFERARRAGLLERAPNVTAIRTADYPTRAKRPAFSVLDTSKLRAAFGIALPDWQTTLDGVIDELR